METSELEQSGERFQVVGIGASAGGLEALLQLFHALPSKTSMAFVVVQHLEPHYESQLAEILARATEMPVVQAQEGLQVSRNHVYVIPPNATMIIVKGALHLSPRPESSRPHFPIDIFLESLAKDKGGDAIGLILSGSASDGAQGIRFVKTGGGTTFAQDERSAKYGGMPHSAMMTGAVDFILSPEEMAEELVQLESHPYFTAALERFEEPLLDAEDDGDFRKVLDRLSSATRVDFAQYKRSTIRRRLGRRLVVNHLETLEEYLEYLDGHPYELQELYREILISVTCFFREPEMYEALGATISEYLASRKGDDPFRIWVPGCATGEEAYSLAVLSFEILQKSGGEFPIQIFGTDISESAIERARSGVYTEKAAEDIPPERLQRFFVRTDAGFRIKQQVRDCCIFARHDLTSDPPFSQMDLVSCRNVFIYLSAGLQQRVLPALHYSLKSSGLLVLGTAETVGNRADLFGIVSQENKIYVKRPVPSHLTAELKPVRRGKEAPTESTPLKSLLPIPVLVDLEARAARILRDLYAPAGVLINEDMQILHFHGNVAPYLAQIPGETNVNLLRVAREELLTPIRRTVASALAQKQPAQEAGIQVHSQGETRSVNLSVMPLSDDAHSCLVLFEEEDRRTPALPRGGAQDQGASELELGYAQRELAQTKDYLRKIIEQHDAATEELRAANEEARSSNEELQSTNEELRTAKEQLQSTNEELTTVNDELHHRNKELSDASNDLSNILGGTKIPIVMVGMDLRLRRFTPAAERLLGLAPVDIGRAIVDLHYAVHLPNLEAWLRETIETLLVQQKSVRDREGRWFNLFIRPYRTIDERIDGAVLTFIDIDDVTRALEREEEARRFADGIVETVQHPLLILDADLRVRRATRSFYETFSVPPNETLERGIDDLGDGQWNLPELRHLLEETLVRDRPFQDFEVTHDFPHIGKKIMRLNARRIATTGKDFTVLLAIEDVTDRRESAEIHYRRLFESAKDAIIVLSAPSGIVLDVNPCFLEVSRYPLGELMGKPFREIAPFLDQPEMRQLVPDTLREGMARHEAVRLRARDGRELIVEIVANRYAVKDQVFVQVNIRDVTERKRDEDRLRGANLDLQQFAFAASHDLQEPLRTVTGYLELIKRDLKGKLDQESEQHVQFVLAAADRMRQLILDLLGYSQIVRADLKLAPVSTEAALSTALLNLQMAIHSSGARITFDSLPVVYMDETQLIQLLQNLVGNAIKYRDSAPPSIHISAREAGPEWIFSVQDNGIGIDMKFADQIFAVFKRLHGREYPGTGVGLAISKKIVERRGGRIWIDSAPGRGSTFYFTVPKESKQNPSARIF